MALWLDFSLSGNDLDRSWCPFSTTHVSWPSCYCRRWVGPWRFCWPLSVLPDILSHGGHVRWRSCTRSNDKTRCDICKCLHLPVGHRCIQILCDFDRDYLEWPNTFVIYFGTIQSPLQTNEVFEDRFEVIMGFYIPNSRNGNSEKIK